MMSNNTHEQPTLNGYITGVLHSQLQMIRNDLHMADSKAALAKVNDALRFMDEKVLEISSPK